MVKNKIDLEYAFSKLKGRIITQVWYSGKCTIRSGYHAAEGGLFLEFKDGDVFHIYPADELKQKFIHGVYIKKVSNWVKERRYFKYLENVTVEWKHLVGNEIQVVRLNWEIIINHKISGGHPKSRTDYPHCLELHFENDKQVYLHAMKIVEGKMKPYFGYPEITVFFDFEVRDKRINR